MALTTPALRRAVLSARRAEEETQAASNAKPQVVNLDTEPVKARDHHPLDAAHDEMQLPVAKRDWSFWAALGLLVVPVYAVVPLSWAYTLYICHRIHLQDTLRYCELALFGYTLFETLFSIYYQALLRYARTFKSHIATRDIHELQLMFTRVLQTGLASPVSPNSPPRPGSPAELITPLKKDDPRAFDFRNHFRLWFHGVPWSHITRKAMTTWLSWNVFDKPAEELDKLQEQVIKEALVLLERRTGGRLNDTRPGGLPDVEPTLLTFDPVNVLSRPGIIYFATDFASRLAQWYLQVRWDMKLETHEGVDYLIRCPPSDIEPSQHPMEHASPVVFMHGLGFGIAQYLFTILLLLRNIPSNQPVIVPLQPNVSQAIFHPSHLVPLPRETWIKGLKDIIDQYGGERAGAMMISHSMGTLTHCWMLKAYPELIRRSCLVDPVTFCLWEGNVCHNFIYRIPTNGIELLMRYFVGTEPGIALAVQRHFDWFANSLWFEEIPRAHEPYYATFFVGGSDAIVDGYRVKRYLEDHGVEEGLHWDPKGVHGQPVIHAKGMKKLIDWITAVEPAQTTLDDSDSESDIAADDAQEVAYTLVKTDLSSP